MTPFALFLIGAFIYLLRAHPCWTKLVRFVVTQSYHLQPLLWTDPGYPEFDLKFDVVLVLTKPLNLHFEACPFTDLALSYNSLDFIGWRGRCKHF